MFIKKFNQDISEKMKQGQIKVKLAKTEGSDVSFNCEDNDNLKLNLKLVNFEVDNDFKLEDHQTVKSAQLYDFEFDNAKLIDAGLDGYRKIYANIIIYANYLVFTKGDKVLRLIAD